MRNLIVLFSLMFCSQGFAQDQALVNTWGKGSRYLYIGVNNELKQHESKPIISAYSKEASVSFSLDSTSLIVKPRLTGPVTITMGTAEDSLVVVYEATYLPYPQISIGDSSFHASTLSLDQARNALNMRIKGDGKGSSIFDQCFITCAEIQIGDFLYSFSGDAFSDEIKQALGKINTGDNIIIKKMMLEVRNTGKQIRLDPARTFKVQD